MMRTFFVLGLGFILLCSFVVAPIAFSDQTPTETLLSKINRLSPAERQRALETGARKEGVVDTVGFLSLNEVGRFQEAFRAVPHA